MWNKNWKNRVDINQQGRPAGVLVNGEKKSNKEQKNIIKIVRHQE